MKNRIVTREAFARSATDEMIEKRQMAFVISSEAVDAHHTVFKMDGWDLNRYLANPIVCYQHKSYTSDPDDIIGTSEVFIEGNKLIGRVTFEDAETNPKAEKVFKKVCSGTLKMASVGARVLKARFGDDEKGEDKDVLYFTKARLFEWSIVSAGSNPDALKRNDEVIGEIKTEVVKDIKVEDPEKIEAKRSVFEAQILINN